MQTTQNLDQMLADLPTACDVGSKKNSKGYKETWIGYKLHLDVACGQIPVSCVLTSASVHDSQVAIPLMTMTGARVSYLYDLMDAAYDAAAIHDHSKALGHAPIIDRNFRAQHEAKAEWAKEVERMKLIHMPDPDDVIFNFRTLAERVNARLKDQSAHGPCACAARSRSNATSCSACWRSRSIKYSASRSSGPRRPERRPLRPREHRENSPRSMNFARGSGDKRQLLDAARDDMKDQHYTEFCLRAAISTLIPTVPFDTKWKFGVVDLGNDGFLIDTNVNFAYLDSEYKKVPGQEEGEFTGALIAAYVFGARADFCYFASTYMSGYVCDEISSVLMKRRFTDLIRRKERDAVELDLFQEKILPEGRTVREVINSGERPFSHTSPGKTTG